ncbi:hypothetical protein ACFYO1_38255 [Nocardia sp. NPDC006044]|uniref:hypothetical protein n=1 Tax=Nocardia sp. NPDC006044 TaxID=3364306 RepID=UPI0036A39BBB
MTSTSSAPAVSATIPPGYFEMPLRDTHRILERATSLVRATVPDALKADVPSVIGTAGFFLEVLAAKNAVYCGMGKHSAENGEPVVSWLTVSVVGFGDERNPRLVVGEITRDKVASGGSGSVEIVDVAGRPMVFTEDRRTYTAARLSSVRATEGSASVFQIEAVVPSDNGASLAVIEFSTAALEHGPEYRAMVLGLAASIKFHESASRTSSLDL